MTKLATPRAVLLFAVQVLALSVVLFALWYYAYRPVSAATAWIAGRLVEAAAPVERVRQKSEGRQLTFEVEPDVETARRNRLPRDAVIDVPVNPLKHTFGLPFFLALLLASRPAGLAWKAPVGAAAILLLAGVGLACDLLVQVGAMKGVSGGPLFEFRGGAREAIALGFQLGTLMFPTVVPAMLWAAMDRATLRQFIARQAPGSG